MLLNALDVNAQVFPSTRMEACLQSRENVTFNSNLVMKCHSALSRELNTLLNTELHLYQHVKNQVIKKDEIFVRLWLSIKQRSFKSSFIHQTKLVLGAPVEYG